MRYAYVNLRSAGTVTDVRPFLLARLAGRAQLLVRGAARRPGRPVGPGRTQPPPADQALRDARPAAVHGRHRFRCLLPLAREHARPARRRRLPARAGISPVLRGAARRGPGALVPRPIAGRPVHRHAAGPAWAERNFADRGRGRRPGSSCNWARTRSCAGVFSRPWRRSAIAATTSRTPRSIPSRISSPSWAASSRCRWS